MPNHFLKLENSWLLSSGFAEGKPGPHILTPTAMGPIARYLADGPLTL